MTLFRRAFFLFPLGLLILTGCSNDDGPTSILPAQILTIGPKVVGPDLFLSVTSSSNSSTTEYNLTADFNLFNTRLISTENNDLHFPTTLDWKNWDIITYNANVDQFEIETIVSPLSFSSWVAATKDWVVFTGDEFNASTSETDVSMAIYDRNSKGFAQVVIAENSSTTISFRSLIIKEGYAYFTYLESGGSSKFVQVDLAAKEVSHTLELGLVTPPYIVISPNYVHSYNLTDQTIDNYDLTTFELQAYFDVTFSLPIGISQTTDDISVQSKLLAQPAPLTSTAAVVNLTNGEVVKEIDLTALRINQEQFEESIGTFFANVPSVIHINPATQFVLYNYYAFTSQDPSEDEYGLVYSNYEGQYLGHVNIPVIVQFVQVIN